MNFDEKQKLAERIAAGVMGWKRSDSGRASEEDVWTIGPQGHVLVRRKQWCRMEIFDITDPAVMVEIMEAMRKRGYILSLHWGPNTPALAEFRCSQPPGGVSLPACAEDHEHADTPMLAVALAAEKAVGDVRSAMKAEEREGEE